MKIEKESRTIKFKDLAQGEVFAFEDSMMTYMKVFGLHSCNAVQLDTGDADYYFNDDKNVIWLSTAKLVI